VETWSFVALELRMNVKKVAPLVAAVVLGLISARMVVVVLHSRTSVQTVSGPKLAKVVTANRDISAGEPLGEDDLTIAQVVADSAPGRTFSDPAEVVGRVAATQLLRGQPIIETLLAPKGSGSGLAALIPPGMRAVTLSVDEVTGVAGYVTPGCRVDILLTVRDDKNEMAGRCLAQNVQVTAVGTRSQDGADASSGHSVTLLVTPSQAELLELASSDGRPRLVLRSSRDHLTDELEPVTQAELIGSPPMVPERIVPAAVDPFAASTQPATRVASGYQMRVITAGETSVVNIGGVKSSEQSAVTGADPKEVP
jgi:pilus assembly protein CpaB